jgi:hypothetical protein
MIYSSVLVATLAAIVPLAAYAQTKPNVTVINPVSNPVNTRITNAVVPVEISNADPVPVETVPTATPLDRYRARRISVASSQAVGDEELFTATESLQITGVVLVVNAGGTSGSCTYTLGVANAADELVALLASVNVFSGRSLSSPAIPIPNLTLPAGYQVRYYRSNSTQASCQAEVNLYMIKA